jgi:hypothetical protein
LQTRRQLSEFKKGQGAIAEFTANPENADINKEFDIGLETDSKGVLQLKIGKGSQPTSEQLNKKEFSRLLRSKVEEINEITADTNLTGPIQGPVRRALAETLGGQDEFVKLKQLLDSLIIRVYMLSGKQINETELKFLQSIQPQSNDPTSTFRTRLKGFYDELKTISNISDNLWNEAGIRLPGEQQPAIPAQRTQPQTETRTTEQEARLQELLRKAGQ